MKYTIKYWLCLCILLLVATVSHANIIDTLSTKKSVQTFLDSNIREQGVILLGRCLDISQTESDKTYFAQADTILVEDPLTGGMVMKIIPPEDRTIPFSFTNGQISNYPLDSIAVIMDKFPYRFYKCDIDGNGRTDLIVDAGVFLFVLDMGDRFESHLFSSYAEPEKFSFKNMVSLPTGEIGLVFRYNICKGDTAHITDTVVYKFHGFVRYNKHVRPMSLAKIDYCYCSSNGMVSDRLNCTEINKDGQCYLQYSQYGATFSAKLGKESLDNLWNYIEYLDVKTKKDFYTIWIDHAEGATFTFYFDDGTVKKINIWFHRPPLGLDYLSKNISDISKMLHWERVQKNIDSEGPTLSEFDASDDCLW